MPRIAIVDTAYPAFLSTLPPLTGSYSEELAKYLALGFGTADFYSHNLKAQGWDAIDIIANYDELQWLYCRENGRETMTPEARVLCQIEAFNPDVVFLQDISIFRPDTLWSLGLNYTLALQCSCAFTAVDKIRHMSAIFTSLPGHVEKFKALGVPRVEYLPLAFDRRMLKHGFIQAKDEKWPKMYPDPLPRDIDISFVGGVGRESHWKAGTDVLEAVAVRFKERFHWYGYGIENLSPTSPLRACYRGEAWGADMYRVYGRSKIVVNRHGEVANGYTNNLRVFEATGMGAMLFTEKSSNLGLLFPAWACGDYEGASDLCAKIEACLADEPVRAGIAADGQQHTLKHHTYTQRMSQVSRVLNECLESRKVRA